MTVYYASVERMQFSCCERCAFAPAAAGWLPSAVPVP